MIGQKFNKITVIDNYPSYKWVSKKTGKITSKKRYLCLCDCGDQVIIAGNHLRQNKRISCKSCAYANRKQSVRRLSAEERWFRLHIKQREKQGIKVEIDSKQAVNIAKDSCYYCGNLPKEEKIYKGKFSKKQSVFLNGLDRINSDKSYTLDNIVSCCSTCNFMKNTQTLDIFLSKIKQIYNKHIKNNC